MLTFLGDSFQQRPAEGTVDDLADTCAITMSHRNV